MAETTPHFKGLISMMQPRNSWVAKWNNKTDLLPGVYAMHVDNMNQLEEEEDLENEDDARLVDREDEELE